MTRRRLPVAFIPLLLAATALAITACGGGGDAAPAPTPVPADAVSLIYTTFTGPAVENGPSDAKLFETKPGAQPRLIKDYAGSAIVYMLA